MYTNVTTSEYKYTLSEARKIINIEAKTCLDMAIHQILPAAMHYSRDLCKGIAAKERFGVSYAAELALSQKLSAASDALYACCEQLKKDLQSIPEGNEAIATYYHDVIVNDMQALRKQADILEAFTDKNYWPYPTYSDLLFY